SLDRSRRSTFPCSVVHHSHAWFDSMHEWFCIGSIQSVVGSEINIHFANQIIGADQFEFLIMSEVSHVNESEISMRQQKPDGPRIFGRIRIFLNRTTAQSIRLSGTWQCSRDPVSASSNDLHINTFQRNRVSRLHDEFFCS